MEVVSFDPKTILKKFKLYINFFNFWLSKLWIRIGIQPKMLAPDPDQMNKDSKHCLKRQLQYSFWVNKRGLHFIAITALFMCCISEECWIHAKILGTESALHSVYVLPVLHSYSVDGRYASTGSV
jgi:hypothetical protein